LVIYRPNGPHIWILIPDNIQQASNLSACKQTSCASI